MYQVNTVLIRESHPLYEYCQGICSAYKEMYNSALYALRQSLFCFSKDRKETLDLWQLEFIDSLEKALPLMNGISKKNYSKPASGKWILNYGFLDAYFKVLQHPAYMNPLLPRQSAQQAITDVLEAMKSWTAARKSYLKNPASFTGRPKLPGYKKTSMMTATIVQEAEIKENEFLKFPKTKIRIRCHVPENAELKEVKIIPSHHCFVLSLCFQNDLEEPELKEAQKVMSIDPGVENLCAVVNNQGLECLLVKGRDIQSILEYANTRLSKIQETVMKHERSSDRFKPTERYRRILSKTNRQIKDRISKTAVFIVNWAKEKDMDTIVFGSNSGWKQELNMGKDNNRQFGKMPYELLKAQIEYRCKREGIRFIRQDESYTSKASFPDQDKLFDYDPKIKRICSFSGRRIVRGLYTTKDGTIVNADLNGAANIGRKALPDLFTAETIDFTNIRVISRIGLLSKKQITISQ